MQDAAARARIGDRKTTRALIEGAIELLRKSATLMTDEAGAGEDEHEHVRSCSASLPAWRARQLVNHIESQLDQPLRVDDLARLVGLSKAHFSRCFKGYFGQTTRAYIAGRRMKLARDYMLSTDKSLADIALMCGLSDQSHLTRVFQRVCGDAPGRWRAAQKHGQLLQGGLQGQALAPQESQ
jgi:AraC-like DNA-binding protein